MRKLVFFFLLFLLRISDGVSQDSIVYRKILEFEDFLFYVIEYHPYSRQANLQALSANAGLSGTRGLFDPQAYASFREKNFDKKSYFSVLEAGTKVYSYFGPSFKLSYKEARGDFLNPELYTPENGLISAEITVPLGEGLLFDKRRAELNTAKAMAKLSEAMRDKMINDLLLEASIAYFDLVIARETREVYKEALDLSESQFSNVRQSFIQGDKPAIDTVEALIQVQNQKLNLSQAELNYRNKALELSNFLWSENAEPLIINLDVEPQRLNEVQNNNFLNISLQISDNQIDEWISNNPELKINEQKQAQYEIKTKLYRELIKPKIDLSYSWLNDPDFNYERSKLDENSVLKLNFKSSLFLRNERNSLKQAKYDWKSTILVYDQKKLALTNKLLSYENEVGNLTNQITTASDNVNNYQRMTQAEQRKFEIGESSVFLINYRQQALIKAKVKLLELQFKIFKSKAGMRWVKNDWGF